MKFEPMLAGTIKDVSKLQYPILASVKLDGIRATVQGGKLLSRNLKPISNIHVQARFINLPDGLDGELIYGDPTDEHAFSNTTSIVMSKDRPVDGVEFYVFDHFSKESVPFINRLHDLRALFASRKFPYVNFVEQRRINSEEELLKFETEALEFGHEGLMVRTYAGIYKQGRSSVREGHLLKLKRFTDAEAKVLSVYEEMENQNEATKNLLGHTERSSHKDNMVGKNRLGGFEVIGINGEFKGVEFRIGSGLTGEEKDALWSGRKYLPGKIVKYKYFPIGVKDKPRFPIFLGFRDKADM